MGGMMKQIAQGMWTCPAPLRFAGLKLNTRMSLCRLSEGGLALISPVPLDETTKASVDSLGSVRAIIAPNLLHHLYLGAWMEAYPHALSYVPLGLAEKRPDLSFTHTLDGQSPSLIDPELRCLPIAGMPKLNEALFIHRSSKTLIAADFCFYMPDASGLSALFASLMQVKKQPGCDILFRAMVKDKAAFKASLAPLRALEIEHLSMCHHAVVSERAQACLDAVLDRLKVAEQRG